MAEISMRYIAAFAKSGDPNRSGLPPWPRYDAAIVQVDPWKSRLDLVERGAQAARPR